MKLFSIMLGLFASSVAAVGAESTATEKVNALQVEILVFSGMPDPRFLITDPALIKEIMDLVNVLPAHPTLKGKDAISPKGRLGYRGIRIENVSSANTGIEWFSVFRSNVEIVKKGATAKEFRADAGVALERRLIQMAEEKKVMPSHVLLHVKSGK